MTASKQRPDTLAHASGRWPEILQALGGLTADQLENRHGPCPMCGGKDRYRFDDIDGTGSWLCNQCGGKDGRGGAGSGIDLLMRVRGWDFREAVAAVERHLGGGLALTASNGKRSTGKPWRCPGKPPVDAPPPDLGGAVAQWCYRDSGGDPLFWIQRFDRGEGHKDFIHRVWLDGQWHFPRKNDAFTCAWATPRPLYGLPGLVQRPDAPVLVVEGEKAADAAAGLFPNHVVVSWSNGSNAIGKVDWAPLRGRSVTLWPDNDDQGRQAMQQLSTRLMELGCSVSIADYPADAVPVGWDLADATDWTPEMAAGSLSRVAREVEPPSAPATAEQPAPLTFEQRWAALEAHADAVSRESWPLMKAVASLANYASELELHRLTARNLEQLLEAAHRRQRPTAAPLMPGASFAVRSTPWAVDGLFRHGVNLLVGQPGAGKSRLSAAGIAAWLRGDRMWLGREMPCDLPPEQRHALIIGTDQPLEDWALTLEPVGLVQRLGSGEVQLHPRLTLHSLETGTALDTDGLATIRRWCDAHPHGVVLVDSLAACLPPGIDEDKAAVARPVHALAEAIGTCWAVLTHHSRKAAGKDQNLGVGAGRGSSAIDGAVSRVIGLGLIHKMENGVLTPQESDPRRELLSTKRGGATLHLIVRSDGSGFWSNEGSADDLKRQERRERTIAGLTDAQADVLSVLEDATNWLTGRQVVEGLLAPGEEYDNRGALAAGTRKILKRLEVVGLIETQKVGRDRMFRLASAEQESQESSLARDEVRESGSNCSNAAPQGISPALMPALPGSDRLYLPPEPPEQAGEQVEPLRAAGEQAGEQAKPTAPQHESQESNPQLHASDGTGSTPARIPCLLDGEPGWSRRPGPMRGLSVLLTHDDGHQLSADPKQVTDLPPGPPAP